MIGETSLHASQSPAQAIPFHTDGMRIGLLGGSFNPPHDAHRAISLFAIKRLKLDRVWWLVTPAIRSRDVGPCMISTSAPRPRARSPAIRVDVAVSIRHRIPIHCGYHRLSAPRFPVCAWSGSWALTILARFPSLAKLAANSVRGLRRGD